MLWGLQLIVGAWAGLLASRASHCLATLWCFAFGKTSLCLATLWCFAFGKTSFFLIYGVLLSAKHPFVLLHIYCSMVFCFQQNIVHIAFSTITHIEKHVLNLKFTPWTLSLGA